MAELLITQLDDRLHAGLQRLAESHGRAISEEATDILRQALVNVGAVDQVAREPSGALEGLGTRIARRFANCPSDEPIQELRGLIHPQIPDFES